MILRNYDNAMTARQLAAINNGVILNDGIVFGDDHLSVKKLDGSIQSIANSIYAGYMPMTYFLLSKNTMANSSGNYCSSGLMIGGGDTPVTYDDYKLSQAFTDTQVTPVSHSVSDPVYNAEDKCWERIYTKIYMANEDITVKEIGVCSAVYYNTSETYAKHCLMYREILDTPIDVPTGGNVVLTFKTKISATPNKPADYVATASVE